MARELTVLTRRHDAAEGGVYQWFPANGPEGSRGLAWRVLWRFEVPHNSGSATATRPVITEVSLERAPGEAPLTLIRNLTLTDLWVFGSQAEPLDLLHADDWTWLPASSASFGPACITPGELLNQFLLKEVHDDQLRWKSFHDTSRRGQVLTLWAAAAAGPYQCFVEYGFACDGSISGRLGVFGPGERQGAPAHLFVPCWAFEPDLGNADAVEASLCGLSQRADGKAEVVITPFNKGDEGGVSVTLEEFTTLRLVNPSVHNRHIPPRPVGLDLFRASEGIFRNQVPSVRHLTSDWLVTIAEGRAAATPSMREAFESCQVRSLARREKRVYCTTPIAHWPRAVSAPPIKQSHTQWGGFHLRPRDLFGSTPMYR